MPFHRIHLVPQLRDILQYRSDRLQSVNDLLRFRSLFRDIYGWNVSAVVREQLVKVDVKPPKDQSYCALLGVCIECRLCWEGYAAR